MRTSLIARGVAMLAGFALALTACGGGSDPLSSGSGQTSGAAAPSDTIVVGSANFTESQILAEIYAQALAAKGVNGREAAQHRQPGGLHPGPAGRVDRPHPRVHAACCCSTSTRPRTRPQPDAVYTALQAALPDNLIVLDKSAAEDKDAVVVTRDTATQYNVKSIADLAPQLPDTSSSAGAPEFQTRPDGIPGLQATYNCTFKEFRSLDAGGPLTVAALKNGDVQAANLFTTAVHRSRRTTSSCSRTRRTTSRPRTCCR